jgi:hypothetical protein
VSRLLTFVDSRDSALDMSFDASYGLSEPSSPPFAFKRKVIDDGDANPPSPKRAHIDHEQDRLAQREDQKEDPSSSAKGQKYYWMVQWYGDMLIRKLWLLC